MFDALLTVLGFEYLLYLVLGVVIGIAVGALPGFTATMGVALLLPFTFVLEPGVAIGMLGGLYVAAMYSDAIPAVLVNTPGTPSSMATAFDGYPMTQQGRGQNALVAVAYASMLGAMVGGFAFLLLAPPLATGALRFGPPELFWVAVFALTIIGSIAGDSLLKGVAGGAIGLFVSTIGLSSTGAVTRFTFGSTGLRGGVELVAALIGIFALPQLLGLVARRRTSSTVADLERRKGVTRDTLREIMARPGNLALSSGIGAFIGIIPGAGGPVGALVAYSESKRWSRGAYKAEYGKGSVHGVVASEVANSAAAGGAMVPLVALGVPGSSPAAIIMGALLLQGLNPGPTMFRDTPELVYGFAWSFILAGLVTFVVGSSLARYIALMVKIPVRLLIPIILMLTLIGSYAIRTNVYDVYAMIALGVGVYLLSKLGFHPGPVGLGLILGPIVEPALVQSLALSQATSVTRVFFTRPLSIVLIVLVIASIVYACYTNYQQHKERSLAPKAEVEAVAGRTLSESTIGGVLLVALAAGLYTQTGERVQDWILPWILIGLMGVVGVTMIVRAMIGRGGRRVPIVPPFARGGNADVALVVVMLIVCALVLIYVGFWLSVTLMMMAVSLYLTNTRSLRVVAVAGVTIVSVVFAMFALMRFVFYVPVPQTFFL